MSTNQRKRGFICGREILTVTSDGGMSPVYWNTEFLDGNWVAEAKQTYRLRGISGNPSEEVQSLISDTIWEVIVVHSIVQGCTLEGNVWILFPAEVRCWYNVSEICEFVCNSIHSLRPVWSRFNCQLPDLSRIFEINVSKSFIWRIECVN